MKFNEYDLEKSIYVVDVRQTLHIKQFRKILELMGYPWADRIHHLAYEIVNLPGNVTMSSREGTVVLLDDLIREATRRAMDVVREKNPELEPARMQAIAEAVALGAIKYPMLSRENTKMVTFDWESALDFNGQSAPYIQYAHVRANSILRKVEGQPESAPDFDKLNHVSEVDLVELISRLPEEVQRAHFFDDFQWEPGLPVDLVGYGPELGLCELPHALADQFMLHACIEFHSTAAPLRSPDSREAWARTINQFSVKFKAMRAAAGAKNMGIGP